MSSLNFDFIETGTGVKHTTAAGMRSIKISLSTIVRLVKTGDLDKFYLFPKHGIGFDYQIFGLVPKELSRKSLPTIPTVTQLKI